MNSGVLSYHLCWCVCLTACMHACMRGPCAVPLTQRDNGIFLPKCRSTSWTKSSRPTFRVARATGRPVSPERESERMKKKRAAPRRPRFSASDGKQDGSMAAPSNALPSDGESLAIYQVMANPSFMGPVRAVSVALSSFACLHFLGSGHTCM